MPNSRAIGLAAIALGVGFNIPYVVLASLYDYPRILRQPAETVLARFAEGGPVLILAWYGFMLAALALTPLSLWLAVTSERLARRPALAIGAAVSGALAGLTQAVGLARWVFVVPGLARSSDQPSAARTYEVLNAYGGVAIGEHLGQLLTALFVAHLAAIQRAEGLPRIAIAGAFTSVAIAVGTGEGLALALGGEGGAFSLATILGYLGLTVWLVATGWRLARPNPD